MTCHEAERFIEAMAVGDEVGDGVRAHATGCARCVARLALAQRIDSTLASRAVAVPPPSFTQSVMARLRSDRWRSEQVVDLGFNVAVALGVLLILGGIAGFAWSAGVVALGSDIAPVVLEVAQSAATRVAADARAITIAMLLVTMAAALWWWAEEDLPV
jgi:hypothetical protein